MARTFSVKLPSYCNGETPNLLYNVGMSNRGLAPPVLIVAINFAPHIEFWCLYCHDEKSLSSQTKRAATILQKTFFKPSCLIRLVSHKCILATYLFIPLDL